MIIAVSGVKAAAYNIAAYNIAYKINKAVAVIKKYGVFTHIYFTVPFDFSMALKFHITVSLAE
ncbi:MAG: hypothetical protein IJN22_01920 [Clostridia bacterium]|nr:hypothetical protein [Clostridia bacterium]